MKTIANQATWTAAAIAIGFVFLGKIVFKALGITIPDFQIAGGLVLLAIAIKDLLFQAERIPLSQESIGVVPLGMPLVAGPALITSLIALVDTVGILSTVIALGINLVLVIITFRYAAKLASWVSVSGMKAMAKIVSLLLAAIAVNMIRRGINL
ncbi:MAG: MarC family protein [Deltaproteobacteria bacterium]|nr:MAG: MarC family protein [Deltaproteobacteria bacterium]